MLTFDSFQEHHHNIVQYQLPSGVMALSEVFGRIESSYETLNIEDYSVSQTTLDNVRAIIMSFPTSILVVT